MIKTRFGKTPFTTQQVAQALGCCRPKTTARLRTLADKLHRVLHMVDLSEWSRDGARENAIRSLVSLFSSAGALARAHPKEFAAWIADLAAQPEPTAKPTQENDHGHQDPIRPDPV